jgi:hypothetical protein
MENYSLKANLEQTFSGINPFQGAQPQAVPDAQVMDSPFPDIQVGEAQSLASPQPSMKQVERPLEELDFQALAKKFGLDTKNLAPNQELGSLQLMKRMQGRFSADSPAFELIMKAFMKQGQASMQASATKAERTLGALLGKP